MSTHLRYVAGPMRLLLRMLDALRGRRELTPEQQRKARILQPVRRRYR
jgi:hypothetical protein